MHNLVRKRFKSSTTLFVLHDKCIHLCAKLLKVKDNAAYFTDGMGTFVVLDYE